MKQLISHKIGVVRSPILTPMDSNWGDIESLIKLEAEYVGGLEGLRDFSHALIITLLHQANYRPELHLQRNPRNSDAFPRVGIFSQRAKDRPIPIGVTAVKIVRVEPGRLTVRGLDAIDGTPVLDIKPYYPQYDRIEYASVPEWVDRLMKDYFQVFSTAQHGDAGSDNRI